MAKNNPRIVTFKECAEARQRAHKLLKDVRHNSLIHDHYKFDCCLIGSGKRRCITKDINGKYDLDYQIVLTRGSDDDPTNIKNAFFTAFTNCKKDNEKVENSTTVVTVRCSKSEGKFDPSLEQFSFDFVIINSAGDKRIKRNGQNKYTWVNLPSKHSHIYKKFNSLSAQEQQNIIHNKVIPKVLVEKTKPENQRRASVEIFYMEVNNYQKEKINDKI